MIPTVKYTLNALIASLVFIGAFAQADSTQSNKSGSIPESGLWITESGNLEVEIAPCGQTFCGTIVRVIANRSMNNPAAAMTPANAASPIGKKILFDLKPSENGLQGRIYNRENDKTYNSQLSLAGTDQLKLVIYEDSPASGKTQLWKRSANKIQ